jgi:hypothetical protein
MLLRKLCLAALAAAFFGCSPLISAPPSNFVVLDDATYDYRATSADGVVIAATKLRHEPRGELSFWVRAVENRMHDRGGYRLVDQRDVKTSRGLAGRELRFRHDDGAVPHTYVVAVFVTKRHLFLVEAGGPEERVAEAGPQIDAAITRLNAG